MKIATLTMIRHDGDVLEEFVRHTARFVDELYILNNVSLDSSAEILSSLQREGLPLIVRDCDSMTVHDWHYNDKIKEIFGETDADFLIVIDADEFLNSPSRAVLEEDLAELPPGSHGMLPWVTYVPTPEDDRTELRTLARIRYRLASEHRQFHKVAFSRAFVDQPDARTPTGAHHTQNAPMWLLRRVRLAHFPVRGMRQLQAKALLGWSSFLAMGYDEEGKGNGYQWRRLYEVLLAKPEWSEADFFYLGRTYLGSTETELVDDPLPPVARAYVFAEPELLAVGFAFTRQLATAVGKLLVNVRGLHQELEQLRSDGDPQIAGGVRPHG